ncbi:hypothetical protein A8C56_01410 [Niabella ginsenosidivorans]|uniref:Uncharacterized protein n=1 Tax=Niabella ginsenosidivorans TaxID=1176587 RepID=A0A1A9HWP6_9BACT|nr:hypothetical protein [Niabella ginsenosidivorans]ANH79807.1 hypothetical protein A8C56_01410 [Niabella ginsenosidivorans]
MRKTVASIFLVLYVALFVSNALFTHGHVTADGRFILHVHPYNIAWEKTGKKHRHSPSQMEMLNAVHYCTYTHPSVYLLPLFSPACTGILPVPENMGRPHLSYVRAAAVRGPPLAAIAFS